MGFAAIQPDAPTAANYARPAALLPLASIIVPCKGRLHHLRRTLPNMLAQRCEFAYEVIVVDWMNNVGLNARCKADRPACRTRPGRRPIRRRRTGSGTMAPAA